MDPKAALEPTFGRSRKRCTRPPSWSDWPSLLPRAAEGAVTGRIALGKKAHSPNRGSHRQPRYTFGLDQRPCDIQGRGIAECLDAINLGGCTAHKDTLAVRVCPRGHAQALTEWLGRLCWAPVSVPRLRVSELQLALLVLGSLRAVLKGW